MYDFPAWYDAQLHRPSADGIYRRADNALLAADGRPQSGPLRAAELRHQTAEPAPEPVAPVDARRNKGK